jgi:hypothetical protein
MLSIALTGFWTEIRLLMPYCVPDFNTVQTEGLRRELQLGWLVADRLTAVSIGPAVCYRLLPEEITTLTARSLQIRSASALPTDPKGERHFFRQL